MFSTSTPVFRSRLSIPSKWEELLAEMRVAREHGVPGIGAREIATVERTLARVVRRERENIQSVARMLQHYLFVQNKEVPADSCLDGRPGSPPPGDTLAAMPPWLPGTFF